MLKVPASVRKGFPGAGLIPRQDRESCGESRLPRFKGIAHRSGLLYAVQKEQTHTGKLKNLILQPKTCWQTTRGPARHDWRRLCMRPCRIILTPMIRKEAVTDLSGNALVSSITSGYNIFCCIAAVCRTDSTWPHTAAPHVPESRCRCAGKRREF